MAGGAADVVHHFHLVWPIGQLLAQHAVEAQDRVHGGAQFMPHRRHKFVLVGLGQDQGFVGALNFLVACLQLFHLLLVQMV